MTIYRPHIESLKNRPLPEWFDNAKFGIFIHWGLYSVPAWAVQSEKSIWDIGPDEVFKQMPYSEWYLNSLRIEGTATQEYHRQTYGADFDYNRFAEMWLAENWDPRSWARLFKESGARYVNLVTKHHDGFCLWPSRHTEFSVKNKGPKRDIVGELTEAVRSNDIRMGLYYSGLFDWQYTEGPIPSMRYLQQIYPNTYSYADYAYNQVMELIDTYNPDVIWNDIGWPSKGQITLPHLFSYYYNKNKDGVVNDRWNYEWADFVTREYGSVDELVGYKWETCRGIGHSFAYNRNESEEEIISAPELIHLLIDVVSKNGNLLLNIGPRADGTIPDIQATRLRELGAWLSVCGEAIFDTRIWKRPDGKTSEGLNVSFTKKDDSLYALVKGQLQSDHLTIESLVAEYGTDITLLGSESATPLAWEQIGDHLKIRIDRPIPTEHAFVVKLTPASNQPFQPVIPSRVPVQMNLNF